MAGSDDRLGALRRNRLVRAALRRLRGSARDDGHEREREYQVGRHKVLLPAGHCLDRYQRTWRRYDLALGLIAQSVRDKYPDATAIDVGANVGDSAARMCERDDMPVLAIEGSSTFLPYLRTNARRIGDHVEIYEGYVGPESTEVDLAAVTTAGGTSSIVPAVGGGGTHQVRTLGSVLESYPRFGKSRLLKIDTDGFDFAIIDSSLDWIASARPVIFFEYHTGFGAEDEARSLDAVAALMRMGYDRFLVYDNFGNLLISADRIGTFAELNAYLRSNRRHGVAIHYFDVCGFHEHDRDMFDAIHHHEMTVSPPPAAETSRHVG
jgi:FkbM family methyltransferase